MSDTLTEIRPLDAMAVTCPEGKSGNVEVVRFTITEEETRLARVRALINGGRGLIEPGTYTKLLRDGCLWMSDSPDERSDHVGFIFNVQHRKARTVLINGLGLGMVAQAVILTCPTVEQITVCDIDPDVIALVGPHLTALAEEHGKYLDIVEGDAYTPAKTFPKGSRWDCIWSDIWLNISADENWEGYCRVRRAYSRRCDYHGQWAYDLVKYQKRTGNWR